MNYDKDSFLAGLAVGRLLWAATSSSYITFSSLNPFTLATKSSKGWDGKMEWSVDKNTWAVWNGRTTLSAVADEGTYKLYLRGTGNTIITGSNYGSSYWRLSGTAISCRGNIETLLDYATVENGQHPAMGERCFYYMFYNCTALVSAPSLPATALTYQCYSYMFRGCISLTSAPALPATTLAPNCYSSMFNGCAALTTAPVLQSTTMESHCYDSMFFNCIALTTAPELPATTLAADCYYSMFEGCGALTTVPGLPATTLAQRCYNAMFRGCISLTSAPALPATSLASNCYTSMFSGCTALETIPVLPATTLTSSCYFGMFAGCTSVKISSTQTGEYQTAYRIPESGTGVTAGYALDSMFMNTGGTFTGSPAINTTYYTSNTVIS